MRFGRREGREWRETPKTPERYRPSLYTEDEEAAEPERADEAEDAEAEYAEAEDAEAEEAELDDEAEGGDEGAEGAEGAAALVGVRIFARRAGDAGADASAELELLRKLPIRCEHIEPTARWMVVDGTAVVRVRARTSVAEAALEATRRLAGMKRQRVVVIVDGIDEVDAALEPTYTMPGTVSYTTYAGRHTAALVSATDRAVVVDEDASFFSCTLIDDASDPRASLEHLEIARREYCAGVRGTRLRAESKYLCHRKVMAFAVAESARRGANAHEIVGDFERVFVTSDVHADLRKFVQVLRGIGLVTTGKYAHGDIYADARAIYELAWETRWAARNTLLVICGDLVDGFRGTGTGDELGSCEFLLHCVIYNFRIQARALGSEVRFTIGNHDAATVTAYPPYVLGSKYVEDAHVAFAGTCGTVALARIGASFPLIWRRNMLLPFYACSPYLMLTFGKTVFVHAGFVSEAPGGGAPDIYGDALRRQAALDGARLERADVANVGENIGVLVSMFLPTKGLPGPGVIWARGYAMLSHEGACDKRNAAHQKFELIVVGHCVTHAFPQIQSLLAEQCAGDTEGATGCVITRDCRGNGASAPLIALVDTGMSASFRDGASNVERGVGLLLLDKTKRETAELRVVDGYYVYRLRTLERTCLVDAGGRTAGFLGREHHV